MSLNSLDFDTLAAITSKACKVRELMKRTNHDIIDPSARYRNAPNTILRNCCQLLLSCIFIFVHVGHNLSFAQKKFMPDAESRKLPVTILTGFLGAGKTTLLQRLVRECEGKRLVVIQNEVSEEMGIESAVLTDSSGKILPDFFELPNGCICCTSKDDMVTLLENIVSLGRERVDAVVVETTGVADPCTVAGTFWVDEQLGCSVYLDGIVAVVDTVNFSTILDEGHYLDHSEIARKQIAIADRIILNKCDIASEENIAETRRLIHTLNPVAEIVSTDHAKVDPEWVLNIGSLSEGRLASQLQDNHHDACDSACNHHGHLSSVDHVLLKFNTGGFHLHTLEAVIGEILWEHTCGRVFRVKGILRGGNNAWHVLQGVGALFEVSALPQGEEQPEVEKILFIGSDLNEEWLRSMLESSRIRDRI